MDDDMTGDAWHLRPVTARSRARRYTLRRPSTAMGRLEPPLALITPGTMLRRGAAKKTTTKVLSAGADDHHRVPDDHYQTKLDRERRRLDYGMRMPFLLAQPPLASDRMIPRGVYTMVPPTPTVIQSRAQVQSRILSDPLLEQVHKKKPTTDDDCCGSESVRQHAGFLRVANEIRKNKKKIAERDALLGRGRRAKPDDALASEAAWHRETKAGCVYWVNDGTGDVRTTKAVLAASLEQTTPPQRSSTAVLSAHRFDVACSPDQETALLKALDEAFASAHPRAPPRSTNKNKRGALDDDDDVLHDCFFGTGALTYDPAPCATLFAHLDALATRPRRTSSSNPALQLSPGRRRPSTSSG